jgi:lysine 2,3-aminomutase
LYEILIRATWFCPNKCQFCYTGEDVLEKSSKSVITREDIDAAIDYVKKVNTHNVDGIVLDGKIRPKVEIKDILISGGEVMGLPNEQIEYILKGLREIGFKGVIRIGTKVLATMPQRFDEETVNMLAKYLPLQIDASITHPKELTPELDQAVKKLQKNYIMINSGTVLLKGINDTGRIIEELLWGFHIRGIRPEYFYRVIGRYGQWAKTKRESDFKLFEPFWNHKKVPGTVIPKLVDPTELGKVIYGSSTFKIESNKGLYKIFINGKSTLIKD